MREIRKYLQLEEDQYYEVHLSLINCILPVKLTPKEIEVLSAFMSLKGDIAKHRFGPSAKKIVMQRLGLSPAGLSNHMRSLVNKQFLIETGDIIEVWSLLMPEQNEQLYMFRLQNVDYASNGQ
jgi:hypothetical protein